MDGEIFFYDLALRVTWVTCGTESGYLFREVGTTTYLVHGISVHMFGRVFHKSTEKDPEIRRITISMSSKKPITLRYVSAAGERILLANETTAFRGEIGIDATVDIFQCSFEGDGIKNKKNVIKLEIDY